MATSSAKTTTNQQSEVLKIWERSLPGTMRQMTKSGVGPCTHSGRRSSAHSPLRWALTCIPPHFSPLQSWARRIEGRLKWLQPFIGFSERMARDGRLSSLLCMCQSCRAVRRIWVGRFFYGLGGPNRGVRGHSPGKILVLRCLNPCFFSSFSSRR